MCGTALSRAVLLSPCCAEKNEHPLKVINSPNGTQKTRIIGNKMQVFCTYWGGGGDGNKNPFNPEGEKLLVQPKSKGKANSAQ